MGGSVFGGVVGAAVFPAAIEDADPFEGEGADGGVVGFAALALVEDTLPRLKKETRRAAAVAEL